MARASDCIGSVGIIMSGWLGALNYGVIVSNEVDKFLAAGAKSVRHFCLP